MSWGGVKILKLGWDGKFPPNSHKTSEILWYNLLTFEIRENLMSKKKEEAARRAALIERGKQFNQYRNEVLRDVVGTLIQVSDDDAGIPSYFTYMPTLLTDGKPIPPPMPSSEEAKIRLAFVGMINKYARELRRRRTLERVFYPDFKISVYAWQEEYHWSWAIWFAGRKTPVLPELEVAIWNDDIEQAFSQAHTVVIDSLAHHGVPAGDVKRLGAAPVFDPLADVG